MAVDSDAPPTPTNSDRYAEIVGGDPPSPFAVVSLFVALVCALIALPTWPDVSDWWFVAALFGVAAVILAAFAYLGLPGQDDAPDAPSTDDTAGGAH